MRQRLFLCGIAFALSLIFWSCRNDQSKPENLAATTETQTELWQRVYRAQDQSQQIVDEAWYSHGVPMVPKTVTVSELDAAIANVLLYYDRRLGIFTPAEDQTDEQFIKNVRDIAANISTENRKYRESEVIEALMILQRKRAEQFRKQTLRLPDSSKGGYIAQFVARHRTQNALLNTPRSFGTVATTAMLVTNDYDYWIEFLIVDTEPNSRSTMRRGAISVIWSTSDDKAYTVVGYLRGKEAGSDYLVVHDPSVSQLREVPPDTLVRSAGTLAATLRADLRGKPLVKIDDIGVLNEKTTAEPPIGVRILPIAHFENMEVLITTGAHVNPIAIRSVLPK